MSKNAQYTSNLSSAEEEERTGRKRKPKHKSDSDADGKYFVFFKVHIIKYFNLHVHVLREKP